MGPTRCFELLFCVFHDEPALNKFDKPYNWLSTLSGDHSNAKIFKKNISHKNIAMAFIFHLPPWQPVFFLVAISYQLPVTLQGYLWRILARDEDACHKDTLHSNWDNKTTYVAKVAYKR